MSTPLLRASVKIVLPLQIALALYLLLRGHNEPGGGFIGGLVAASGVLLYGVGFGYDAMGSKLPVSWFTLVLGGLALAFLSALPSLVLGQSFLTGVWGPEFTLPVIGKLKLGTVLLFDIGVFLLVTGFVTGLALSFAEHKVRQ